MLAREEEVVDTPRDTRQHDQRQVEVVAPDEEERQRRGDVAARCAAGLWGSGESVRGVCVCA